MSIENQLKNQEEFTLLETQIANFFLDQKQSVETLSTRDIATKLYTTPSKIVRFCQKLGFRGFSQFKTNYLEEIKMKHEDLDYNFPFSKEDKTTQLSNKMGDIYHRHIDETLRLLDHDRLNNALFLLLKAREIVIISSGTQADLARGFQERMIKIGASVHIEKSMDLAYYQACHAKKTTTYIIISYTGETPSTLKVAKKIKMRECPIIALTSNGDNSLSKLANVSLFLSTHESIIQSLGHFGANLSTLLLLDLLYAQYFNQNYDYYLDKRIEVTKEYQTKRHSNNPLIKD